MSKIAESVIKKEEAYAGQSPALDLKYGGQGGFMPAIGIEDIGNDGQIEEWISNQAYVQRNIIPVVLKYPRFFDFLPAKEKMIQAYKSLIELHPLTIEGLTSGLTVEFDEHAVGGGGEMQEEITNVVRARSNPSFTYKEKAGKSIQKFIDFIIRYGYMDPDTKQPLVTSYLKASSNYDPTKEIYSPDFYTGSVLFIEPDVLQQSVVDAWLCVNMAFKGNGERTGKRDIHSAGEAPELSLESSAITINNQPVLRLATAILKGMTVITSTPDDDMKMPLTGIDSNIVNADVGFDDKKFK